MRKFLSVLLAMAMVFSLSMTCFATEDTAATKEPEIMTEEATMAGKTVILHTNDVHGAISGYAKVAALKDAYEAEPERWNNCPDMMDCDPWEPPAEPDTANE